MPSDLRELILSSLSEEPNLTTEQLHLAVGGKLNTLQRALKELQKKKVLAEPERFRAWTHYFWRLKSSKKLTEQSYKHEKMCGDVWAGLKSTGEDFIWIPKSDGKSGFRFDRAFKIFGNQFFLEAETGTHYHKRETVIPEKVEHYLKLDGRFHVIFAVQDYEDIPAKKYADELIRILTPYNRGSQFLVSPCIMLHKRPLSECLIRPRDGALFSLQSVQ